MLCSIGLLEDVCDDGGYLLCSIVLLEDVCDDGGYLLCSIVLLEDVCDDGGYLLCSIFWKFISTSAGSIPDSYDMCRYLILVRYSILDTFVVNLPKTSLFNRVDDHANFL